MQCDFGCSLHRLFTATKDLDAERPLLLFKMHLVVGDVGVADQSVGADKFGVDSCGPHPSADLPEWRVGDILHGWQDRRPVARLVLSLFLDPLNIHVLGLVLWS